MPWTAPTAGWIDRRYNLRCASCAEKVGAEVQAIPVSGEQWFTEDDRCNDCGDILRHYKTSEYVRAAY